MSLTDDDTACETLIRETGFVWTISTPCSWGVSQFFCPEWGLELRVNSSRQKLVWKSMFSRNIWMTPHGPSGVAEMAQNLVSAGLIPPRIDRLAVLAAEALKKRRSSWKLDFNKRNRSEPRVYVASGDLPHAPFDEVFDILVVELQNHGVNDFTRYMTAKVSLRECLRERMVPSPKHHSFYFCLTALRDLFWLPALIR